MAISALWPSPMVRSGFSASISTRKVRVCGSAERATNRTIPSTSRPSTSRVVAVWPMLMRANSASGRNPTNLIGSRSITVAHNAPGCINVPSSAVSLSNSPLKGARISTRANSSAARSMAASAERKAASALLRLAEALAARISEAKPLSFRRVAALASICAAASCASAVLRAASASARAAARVPSSIWHRISPAVTDWPALIGSEIIRPEVSARISTKRAASDRPRRRTASEITSARLGKITTRIASPNVPLSICAASAAAGLSLSRPINASR